MNELHIKVPISKNRSVWFDFINQYRNKKEVYSTLIVDFNEIKFLDTNKFVLLACLIEYLHNTNCKVLFIGGTLSLNNHLNNIKFKNYWEPDFNKNEITYSNNNTTLCLWKISLEHIYSYSELARDYFEGYLGEIDLTDFSISLREVFNNIFDHSKSEITGYIISQYFPNKKKLSFSVCDFGLGIPTTILKSNLLIDSREHNSLILKSLDYGVSCKSTPKNRGFGLNNLLNICNKASSSLLVISNNGYVKKTELNIYINQDYNFNFSGTLINVQFDLNTFGIKDFSEEILDF